MKSVIRKKLSFYSSATLLYGLTLFFAWYVLRPLPAQPIPVSTILQAAPTGVSAGTDDSIIAGIPVRVVIPDSDVDLPVDPGYYDADSNTWTLSGLRAQFAMISAQANNFAGDTFIYGHNNNDVFGALRHNTPAVGAQALVYTDNGHIFSYKFEFEKRVAPDDVSALAYTGASKLTIQTCTGSLNEYRSMYRFAFDKVVQ